MKRALQFGGIGLLGLSAVLLATGVIQFILPPTFESVAKILVQPETNHACDISGRTIVTNGPCGHFIPSEFERLQSKMMLYQVITNLDLNQKWGEKYKEGLLSTEATYLLLKRAMAIREDRNTQLIEIRVRSDDPAGAAEIANEIAGVYRNQRIVREHELRRFGFKAIEGEAQKLRDEIVALEGQVKELGAQLNLTIDSEQPPGLENDTSRTSFFRKRRELEDLNLLRKESITRMIQERIDARMTEESLVQVVDRAEPNLRPIKPHPMVKIIALASGLLGGVLGVSCLMLGVMMRESAKKSPPS